MENDVIERVARALFKMFRSVPPLGDAWRDYVDDARTILAAIREPSEGMKRAGWTSDLPYTPSVRVDVVWQAMIDAALSDSPTERT